MSRHDSTHWLTLEEACALSGLGPKRLRHEIRAGLVIGREQRWNFWDVQDWLDAEAVKSARSRERAQTRTGRK